MTLVTRYPQPDIALVGDDLYSVLSETDTIGFVHKVGAVFVALWGDNLGHAIEIGQSPEWDQAVSMVVRY